MGPAQVALSGIMTILVYSLILFAVFKIFQIATDLGEIKELLKDIKRNSEDHAVPALATTAYPEAASPGSLLRAVSDASYVPPPEVTVAQVPDIPRSAGS